MRRTKNDVRGGSSRGVGRGGPEETQEGMAAGSRADSNQQGWAGTGSSPTGRRASN